MVKMLDKRAVSPVIAALLLIVIAVASATIFYLWVTGNIMSAKSGAERDVTTLESKIKIDEVVVSENNLIVYVRNIGDVNATVDVAYLEKSGVIKYELNSLNGTLSIPPKTVYKVVYPLPSDSSAGTYSLKIGTASGVVASVVISGGQFSSKTWSYRRTITITENSGNTLTDFQVKIVLNTANFDYSHAKSDGSDIRFTDEDGTTQLSFWIEKWDPSGESIIWVKVPEIPASSTKTIYMYYGNPSASSASSGDATFVFFDDFDGSSLDSSKWKVEYSSAGTYSVSNSILYINLKVNTGTSKALTIEAVPNFPYSSISDYIFESYVKANAETNPINGWILSGMGVGCENSGGLEWDYKYLIGWEGYYDTYALHSWIGYMRTASVTASNDLWYTYYLHIESSSSAVGCIGSSCASSSWDIGSTTNYELVVGGQGNTFVEYWFDWIRVRKYAAPEPTVTVGAEEEL
ncbi:MAG: hypothetical protein B6U95_05085 [Thermofilum sp. ex4484_82]|nr:MAG: hypothetical protein B6U95_05085 [Thermofilum sp. ex4484_82]OYT38155.1 MAG: hypothetical protein B6U96_05080 [Archaeoglobales archaeon ex4484_92]